MHIWIIEIGEPLPEIDGSFRDLRCGLLAKSLVAHQHQVTWWASNFNHFSKTQRFDTPRAVDINTNYKVQLLAGPGYKQNGSLKRFAHHRIIANSFAEAAAQSVKAKRPDVVFCCLPTLELAEQAVAFGQKFGIPVVLDVRDRWPDHYLTLAPKPLRWLVKLVLNSEFRRAYRALNGATSIIAISNTFLKWALALAKREKRSTDRIFPMGYPAKSSLSTEEIEQKQAHLISTYGIDPDALVITFVGTFGSSYALDTVINAAQEINQTHPKKVQFIIIGDGDEGAALRAQAKGISNVIFTGWFDQLSIVAMLQMSAVGLAPYRHDALMSLPNKPFEYMANKLPLLSSLPGELETLIHQENIGLQYHAHNVDTLVACIHQFLANPSECEAMGQRAREIFEERFSVEVVYPKLIKHLEQIAGN